MKGESKMEELKNRFVKAIKENVEMTGVFIQLLCEIEDITGEMLKALEKENNTITELMEFYKEKFLG